MVIFPLILTYVLPPLPSPRLSSRTSVSLVRIHVLLMYNVTPSHNLFLIPRLSSGFTFTFTWIGFVLVLDSTTTAYVYAHIIHPVVYTGTHAYIFVSTVRMECKKTVLAFGAWFQWS